MAVGTTASIVIMAVSIALSIASAAVSYQQQQQQAAENQARTQKQMVEAQNETIRQNSALANAAFINDTKQLQNRQAEEAAAAAAREHGVQIEATKTGSTAATAAGEAGVSGLSVNALLTDYTRQEVDYRFQSQTQLENQRNQTEAELRGAQIQGQGRVDSVKPYMAQSVSYPSLMGAALRVGSDSFSAYNAYSAKTPTVPKSGGGMGYGSAQAQYAGELRCSLSRRSPSPTPLPLTSRGGSPRAICASCGARTCGLDRWSRAGRTAGVVLLAELERYA